jgi:hypothetical protein
MVATRKPGASARALRDRSRACADALDDESLCCNTLFPTETSRLPPLLLRRTSPRKPALQIDRVALDAGERATELADRRWQEVRSRRAMARRIPD